MKNMKNVTEYTGVFIALGIIILLGLYIWLAQVFDWPEFSFDVAEPEARLEEYVISDRAEIFSVSGGSSGHFKEVIFDPYIVLPPTETQHIVVTLKNPDEIKDFKIKLEDEIGTYEQSFCVYKEMVGKTSYIIKWDPQGLIYSKYYPIEVYYTTHADEVNSMGLYWHSEFIE